jgi:phenylacetate-CoA ligase
VKRISSIIGANDGGQIAYQCAEQSGALHHIIDDFNYIEVVDEQGKKVKDGTPGKLLITSLLKYAFPLIRYEIGDRGRIVSGLCKCGRTIRTIEYLGRADDVVCVGTLKFNYGEVRNVLSSLPVTELQLVARTCERGDYVTLRVETERRTEELRKEITALLLENMENLGERLKTGALYKLEIELAKPGSLQRNERSGKLKSLIDER